MTATFVTIDDPLAVDGTYGGTAGINNRDEFVGTYLDSSGVAQGFTEIRGTFKTITDPTVGTEGTYAFGVNDYGEVVGYYVNVNSANYLNGYVYLHGSYTTIDDLLGTDTVAMGINDKGDVVGDYQFAGGEEGFVY